MRARDIKCFLLLFVCYAGRHPYAISTQQFMGHKQQVVQEEDRGPQKKDLPPRYVSLVLPLVNSFKFHFKYTADTASSPKLCLKWNVERCRCQRGIIHSVTLHSQSSRDEISLRGIFMTSSYTPTWHDIKKRIGPFLPNKIHALEQLTRQGRKSTPSFVAVLFFYEGLRNDLMWPFHAGPCFVQAVNCWLTGFDLLRSSGNVTPTHTVTTC
jgi:hypothetical protein